MNPLERFRTILFIIMEKKWHSPAPWPLRFSRSSFLLLLLFVSQACRPLNQETPHPEPSPSPAPTLTPLPSPTPKQLPPAPTWTPFPPASPPPEQCPEPGGRLERGVIETKLLDKPMRYTVYLPPCYDSSAENLPVLYLLHGQNYDEEQWIRIGAVTTADRLLRAGQSQPFLIVLPYDYSFKQPTQYNFAQVFLEMLIPQIDAAYRTRTDAASRAIGGLSRGGAWAIHLGTLHPDVFGAVGAHSSAIFFSDMNSLRLRLRDADRATFPRIYIDVGLQDSEYDSALSFAKLLDEMNLPHEWHAYLGFHEEQYWSAHIEEYLRWYAEGWK